MRAQALQIQEICRFILDLNTRPRIFVSVPDNGNLDERRKKLKCAVAKEIAKRGLNLVGFEQDQFRTGAPVNLEDWTVDKANRLIRRCDGALILALARRTFRILAGPEAQDGPNAADLLVLPTPYNHLEGALALATQIPLLILVEENMDRAGIFRSGVKSIAIPESADWRWTKSEFFQDRLDTWVEKIRERRDVFLGYCSKANARARAIRDHLEDCGFSVLDWARDFRKAGATILEEIERAAARCRCAVFLFTKDDELDERARAKANFEAVPRDNVLLEAGYFTQALGKERVAIIRGPGTKMPADLGGIIYLTLEPATQAKVKEDLVTFLMAAL